MIVERLKLALVVAGRSSVPHAVLLLAMRRAHARSHVERDAFRRTTTMDDIDPLARQIGKSKEVRRCCKPLRLETAYLAWRSRTILRRLAADNPAHGRIMPQALGLVHVLISSETAKHRPSLQTYQRMAAVLACARIGKRLARHRGQAECAVELAVCRTIPHRT
jgi:hypothetical protein